MTHTPFHEQLEQLLYILSSYDEQVHEQVHDQVHPEMSNFEVVQDAHEVVHSMSTFNINRQVLDITGQYSTRLHEVVQVAHGEATA